MDTTTRRQRGFTLTESLVVLGILGTVLALVGGSLGEIIHSVRLQAHAGDVLQQLMLARSEAIKRNGRVALCKSADGGSCAQGGSWEQGWILFQDSNNSGTREPHEPLLQQLRRLPPGWRISGNGPVARYVSYGPFGGTQLASGAFQAGTFTVCRTSTDKAEARQIIVNAGGRPRMQKVWLDHCF
jgi:type IV fimbrial biogenesis protein FimT